MVFFVCEGCNETLKRNQVDTHAGRCRNCYAVTCVDCNVSFPENDYKQHLTCISEAEKYEGSLYQAPKKKATKANPQEAWMDLITTAAAQSSCPPGLKDYIQRMADLGNVPRAQKKFANFVKNSLRLRDDRIVMQLWDHLDKLRQQAKEEQEKGNSKSKSDAKVAEAIEEPSTKLQNGIESDTNTNAANGAPKKKKKRKLKGTESSKEGLPKKKSKQEPEPSEMEQDSEQEVSNFINSKNKSVKWKKLIKHVLKKAPGHTLPKSKLRKKVQKELKNFNVQVEKSMVKTEINEKLLKMSKTISVEKNSIRLINCPS